MFGLTDSQQNFLRLTVVTVLFLVTACILVMNNHVIRARERKTLVWCFIALVFITVADWFNVTFSGTHPELHTVHTLLTAIMFAVVPFIPVAIAQAIYPDKSAKWVMVVLMVQAVAEIANIFGGFIFWVDDANDYYRGPLYFVYVAAYALSNVFLVVQSIRAARTYQASGSWSVIAIVVCLAAGIAIQLAYSNIHVTWAAVSMAVVLFVLYYYDIALQTDALTMLLNRHSYEKFLVRPPLPCLVVSVDVNDFKLVNDTYGHAYGDECLRAIARALRHTYASVGKCYRAGGDEFVVVVTKRLDSAEELARRMQDAIAAAQAHDGRIPSVSIGSALAAEGCTDIAAVIDEADKAMYADKRVGKSDAMSMPAE
ncbi:MAG: diguanylate cyclase [Eggerthellaceae bacterium]|nr:diguanylate cyclase [Eggerthellaceae bacterium]